MALTIDILNTTGKVTGKMDLPKEIFDVTVSPDLMAMAVRVYLANQRQATSKVKTRGELDRTTHKVWKQKGTGRARHGSKSAPIFVGGGVAHGPTGDQNYDLKITKRMKQAALRGALTEAVKNGSLIVVEGLADMERSTKALVAVLKAVKAAAGKNVLMLESALPNVISAGTNIGNLCVTQARRTNVYELLSAQKIIVSKPAIAALVSTFAAGTTPVSAEPTVKATKPTQKKTAQKE